MPKVTLYKPKISPPKIVQEYESGNLAELLQEDFDDIFGKRFDKGEEENGQIKSGNVDVCVFFNIKFIAGKATFANFGDVIFENCDFSNTNFDKCGFHRVIFKNCKLTGASFGKCSLSETEFDSCVGLMASFNESKFKQVKFKDCEMVNVAFFECILKDFQFYNNDFSKIEIARTFFKGVDFSDSKIDGARFMIENIKGAKISKWQAVAIMEAYGVEIE